MMACMYDAPDLTFNPYWCHADKIICMKISKWRNRPRKFVGSLHLESPGTRSWQAGKIEAKNSLKNRSDEKAGKPKATSGIVHFWPDRTRSDEKGDYPTCCRGLFEFSSPNSERQKKTTYVSSSILNALGVSHGQIETSETGKIKLARANEKQRYAFWDLEMPVFCGPKARKSRSCRVICPVCDFLAMHQSATKMMACMYDAPDLTFNSQVFF